MTYLPEGDAEYPGSKVWLRKTNFIGMNTGRDYKLVQVIYGSRQFIQPAWSKFAAYMDTAETGWTTGWRFYKSGHASPSHGAPEKVEMVHEIIRRRLIIAAIAGSIGICCALCCLSALIYFCCRHNKEDKNKGGAENFQDDDVDDRDDDYDPDMQYYVDDNYRYGQA